MAWNPKFDIDLQYGEEGEHWLRWLGTDQAKVEVKTERDTWYSTGNVVFEFRSRGKPSGIAVTKSDWWVHILKMGDKFHAAYVFDVTFLKENLRAIYKNPASFGCRVCKGGDDLTSEVILVPLHLLPFLAVGPYRSSK